MSYCQASSAILSLNNKPLDCASCSERLVWRYEIRRGYGLPGCFYVLLHARGLCRCDLLMPRGSDPAASWTPWRARTSLRVACHTGAAKDFPTEWPMSTHVDTESAPKDTFREWPSFHAIQSFRIDMDRSPSLNVAIRFQGPESQSGKGERCTGFCGLRRLSTPCDEPQPRISPTCGEANGTAKPHECQGR